MKKSFASCLFFFTLILLTQSIIIDKAIYVSSAHTNTVNTNSKDDPKRLLQTVTVTTNTAVIIQKDLIMNINIKRSKAKV